MADDKEDSKINHPLSDPPHQSTPFVEVVCNSSGKCRRFAKGTDAGFALTFMNKKLLQSAEAEAFPLASHIEAVKEGEEAVVFGPTATLVNIGHGWKLHTVSDTDHKGVAKRVVSDGGSRRRCTTNAKGSENKQSMNNTSKPAITFLYIGKILLAFVLIFVFGAIFTVILENLPQLILYFSQLI